MSIDTRIWLKTILGVLASVFLLQESACAGDRMLDPTPLGATQHFVHIAKATPTKSVKTAEDKKPVPTIFNQPFPVPLPIPLPTLPTTPTASTPTPVPAVPPGSALPTKPNALTSAQVQANPIALIQTFTVTDLQAALADANAQTPPDETSAQCYTALIPLVQSGIANPLPAGPGVFQLLQKARDAQALLSNLQSATGPLSKLNLACAPLVLSAENTLIQLGILTGTVIGTGGAAGGLLPFALPVLPIPPL